VSQGENVRWAADIPGLGHSSPVVWGDRVFLTTAVSSAKDEPVLAKGWEAAHGMPIAESGSWTWRVICLNTADGKVAWDKVAHEGEPKYRRHPKATYANCTPATDGKYVVAFFGSEGLYCYDMKGELVWKKDLGELNASPKSYPQLHWGFSSSPVIHKNLVIVQCDCANTGFWAAFDLKTGKEVIRVAREDDTTWSTPTVIEAGGRTQVVLNGFKHMGGYDLETGEVLWRLSGGGDVPVPTPQYAHGLVYLTNSHGGRRPLYAVRPEARGDVTPDEDKETNGGLAWHLEKEGAYMPTPIVVGNHIYVCEDNGALGVFDAVSGEAKYKTRLGGGGGNYSASPVSGGGRIYFASEDGDVHALEAGDAYKLVATNSMEEVVMATPAIADGAMYVRTKGKLYCLSRE
jgi:outer membrane protein assembly factor BamB